MFAPPIPPDETPQPPDALPTLQALSEAARAATIAALAFYRRAILIVAVCAIVLSVAILWQDYTLSQINARGACTAHSNHVIAADVHLLIAGNHNPAAYVIPALCSP